jgi:hypothetical protein
LKGAPSAVGIDRKARCTTCRWAATVVKAGTLVDCCTTAVCREVVEASVDFLWWIPGKYYRSRACEEQQIEQLHGANGALEIALLIVVDV